MKYFKNLGLTLFEFTTVSVIIVFLCMKAYQYSNYIFAKQEAETFFHQLQQIIKLYKTKAMFSNTKIIICGSKDQLYCSGEWSKGILVITQHKPVKFYPGVKYGRVSLHGFASKGNKIELLPNGYTHNNGTFIYQANNAALIKRLILNKTAKSYIID